MEQFYGDTVFIDTREFHYSVKVKPEHIKIVSGDADPDDIAYDINRHIAQAEGRAVGWAK